MHMWDWSNREEIYTVELIYVGFPGCQRLQLTSFYRTNFKS